MNLKNQFRSVVQWDNPQPDDLYYRWSERGDEIKNISKLIVNPGQGVIFVYEGKIQAVHLQAGIYELKTSNIPFLTTLFKFMQAFESEHKVGIYYVKITKFLDQKWGTKSPIKYVDPVYKFPVGLRAFGNFSYQIIDPESFFVNVTGIQANVKISDVSRVIADRLAQPLTDLFAESGYAYIEIDKKREEVAQKMASKVKDIFEKLGFSLTDFRIESTDFDDETKLRINKIADTIADTVAANAAGLSYVQMQQIQALRDAAKNEGGLAGAGIGIGVGASLGKNLAESIPQNINKGEPDKTKDDPVTVLGKLKKMLDEGLISQDEYNAKKSEILNKL